MPIRVFLTMSRSPALLHLTKVAFVVATSQAMLHSLQGLKNTTELLFLRSQMTCTDLLSVRAKHCFRQAKACASYYSNWIVLQHPTAASPTALHFFFITCVSLSSGAQGKQAIVAALICFLLWSAPGWLKLQEEMCGHYHGSNQIGVSVLLVSAEVKG